MTRLEKMRMAACRMISAGFVAVVVVAGQIGAQSAGFVLRGEVTDSTGAAVVGAHVAVAGTSGEAVTGDDGRFVLAAVPAGRIHLDVRRLGFRPVSIDLNLIAQPQFLPIVLTGIPEELTAVMVRARPEAYEARLSGFNARKQRGIGYFITRDQIERSTSSSVLDALRRIPGVRIVTNSRGAISRSVSLGAGCAPSVFLDGFPATSGPTDFDAIELGSLEGIEVYERMTAVPPELIGSRGDEHCGVIALWSAPARPRKSASQQLAVDVDELVAKGAVFTMSEVDRAAVLLPGSAAPVFPAGLFKAHVGGRVVIAMVVDSAGDVEPGTLSVVTASDTGFSASAIAAAELAHFRPAVLHGKKVRQLVRLPFEFDPSEPTDSGSAARRPAMFGRLYDPVHI